MKTLNKINSIFFSLLLVAVLLVTGIQGISAAPKSTTINREGVMVSYIGDNYKWARFTTADGKVAYCMDVTKKWPEKSLSASLLGEADKGVRYILENGYPYKSIYGNKAVDQFITQAAVWWYLADTGQTGQLDDKLTSTGADPYNIRPLIKKLVDEAKNAKDNVNVTLNVNVNNTNMALSSDGKSFVSEAITPSMTGAGKYTVTVNNGASVVDANGNKKDTFNAGEAFKVVVPSNSIGGTTNFKVTVKASATVNKAYIYQPGGSDYQRVTALYPEEVNVSKDIALVARMDKPRVCVDYVIVGSVRPDPNLTDPTPGKTCYDKGTKYNQEKQLTTRQENCKFNGWYTKDNLTGKWVDGTALNKDMTLYGAWDCGDVINVPNTNSTISLIMVGTGIAALVAGVGIIVYRRKKLTE